MLGLTGVACVAYGCGALCDGCGRAMDCGVLDYGVPSGRRFFASHLVQTNLKSEEHR